VDRDVNTALKFNQETEFVPILGQISAQLNANTNPPKADSSKDGSAPTSTIESNHHPALLSLLADELSIAVESIHDFEVYVTASLVISSYLYNIN
jgi:aspartyl aminopeptidase